MKNIDGKNAKGSVKNPSLPRLQTSFSINFLNSLSNCLGFLMSKSLNKSFLFEFMP